MSSTESYSDASSFVSENEYISEYEEISDNTNKMAKGLLQLILQWYLTLTKVWFYFHLPNNSLTIFKFWVEHCNSGLICLCI